MLDQHANSIPEPVEVPRSVSVSISDEPVSNAKLTQNAEPAAPLIVESSVTGQPIKESGSIVELGDALPGHEVAIYLTFGLSITAFVLILFVGGYVLFRCLRDAHEGAESTRTGLSENYADAWGVRNPVRQMMSERQGAGNRTQVGGKYSFSRFAGALGAIGFAAVFVSFGFWALCGLFVDPNLLARFGQIKFYLFTAAVFFFPYAANQLNPLVGFASKSGQQSISASAPTSSATSSDRVPGGQNG